MRIKASKIVIVITIFDAFKLIAIEKAVKFNSTDNTTSTLGALT
ncbi:hypothetical protein [Photobacterium angustum]|nr:hypothetical protein [Photobacterium angustum]